MRSNRRSAFTLIELTVVIAVIMIVASLAVPLFQGAKLSANENAALSALRAIASAQASVMATPQIDTDGDGAPEYGYFAELAGTVPARVIGPAAGVAGLDELTPSMLLAAMGQVSGGVITRSGYVFQIYLPAATAGGAVTAIPEDPTGGKLAGPFPDPNNCEVFWCAYAWPLNAGQTGNIALFINQNGALLQTRNRGPGAYSGIGGGPLFDAAFSLPNDMSSDLALGVPANDGNLWVPSD
jgi:type II secretory pathway pseudopilin PulG